MSAIKINGKAVEVTPNITVLEAAGKIGVQIPTLCYVKELDPYNSCMVCIVEDGKSGALIPSCSIPASDVEEVLTDSKKVRDARKAAIELLLSDHVGDCEAPCRRGCPAFLHIPWMMRLVAERAYEKAYKTIREHIPIPSILGRICPAPCERACRRRELDAPVSICSIKRFMGDYGLETVTEPSWVQNCYGERIAVIGAGPAGLTAAYYLSRGGYRCTVFDSEPLPGGGLRKIDNGGRLPKKILDAEIERILEGWVDFQGGVVIGVDRDLAELAPEFDALIVTTGTVSLDIDESLPAVFQARRRQYRSQLAVRAVAEGNRLAKEVVHRLRGFQPGSADSIRERFDSRAGKLSREELLSLHNFATGPHGRESCRQAVNPAVETPSRSEERGLNRDELHVEVNRCLRCDCAAQTSCALRSLAETYGAKQHRFSRLKRNPSSRLTGSGYQGEAIEYEHGKCIRCGICTRICKQAGESPGLALSGRGIDLHIKAPFDGRIVIADEAVARRCARMCPTGAFMLHPRYASTAPVRSPVAPEHA